MDRLSRIAAVCAVSALVGCGGGGTSNPSKQLVPEPAVVPGHGLFGTPDGGCSLQVEARNSYPADGGTATAGEPFVSSLLQLYLLQPDGGWGTPIYGESSPEEEDRLCAAAAEGAPFVLLDWEAHNFDDADWANGGVAVEGIFRPGLTVDLSHASLTRLNRSIDSLDPATSILANITGAQASDVDSIYLYSPEVGECTPFRAVTDGGDVSTVLDYASQLGPVITAAQGDSTYVVQQLSVDTDAGSELAVISSAAVPGFSIVPGSQVTLTANLQPVPLVHSVDVTIDQGAFQSAADAITPLSAYQTYPTVAVVPSPFGVQSQRLWPAQKSFTTDPVQARYSLLYGDVVPGSTNELYVTLDRLSQLAPDVIGDGAISAELPIDAVPTPVAPQVTPVRALQINGMDANSPQTGVGLVPEISWMPPAVGTVAEYRVTLHWVDQGWSGNGFSIFTDQTRLRLPPDYLVAGQRYTATVTAFVSGSRSSPALPLQKTLPEYRADAVSAPFTP